MQPQTVEKRLGSIIDLSRQGKRVNGLFRLLACPLLWEQAYEQVAPNKGALTPGVDPANTLDGFRSLRAVFLTEHLCLRESVFMTLHHQR